MKKSLLAIGLVLVLLMSAACSGGNSNGGSNDDRGDSDGSSRDESNSSGSKKGENPASDFEWEITDGGVRITNYIGDSTEVVIPKIIAGAYVISIGREAFAHRSAITSVVIPDTVSVIEREAFAGCANLSSVTIPDSVWRIGDRAFEGCTSLSSVIIPDSVTAIGYAAFHGCDLRSEETIKKIKAINPNAYVSMEDVDASDYDEVPIETAPLMPRSDEIAPPELFEVEERPDEPPVESAW
jgi:hypothetical protein